MTDDPRMERLRRRFDEGIDPTDAELLEVLRAQTVIGTRCRVRRKGKQTSIDVDRAGVADVAGDGVPPRQTYRPGSFHAL
jgi:hypothetical protein